MAALTIRDLEPEVKNRLRVRAARNGRSMEEEARVILRTATSEDPAGPGRLASAVKRRFQRLGGVELALPAREPPREPPGPR